MIINNAYSPQDLLLYLNYNQDFGCFSVGLENGFRIFNCDPVKEKMRKEFEDGGGIGLVEMLFRCNYLGLVGGGRNPKFPPNKVIIWDDLKGKPVVELEFRSVVRNVKLRRDRIVAILSNKVFVYTFGASPQKLFTLETYNNDKGLVAVSTSNHSAVMAIPGRQKGVVQIVNLNTAGHPASFSLSEPYPASNPVITLISAHTTQLSFIALNAEGTRLATASEKGTLIRVFETSNGRLLHELRRGVDRADIFSISFNSNSTRLCVSSDKGTVHIFNLDGDASHDVPFSDEQSMASSFNSSLSNQDHSLSSSIGNRHSSFSFMKDLLPKYFSSQWSFAHFRVNNEVKCICAFSPEHDSNQLTVLCADGGYYKVCFDPIKGGECERISYRKFLSDLSND